MKRECVLHSVGPFRDFHLHSVRSHKKCLEQGHGVRGSVCDSANYAVASQGVVSKFSVSAGGRAFGDSKVLESAHPTSCKKVLSGVWISLTFVLGSYVSPQKGRLFRKGCS